MIMMRWSTSADVDITPHNVSERGRHVAAGFDRNRLPDQAARHGRQALPPGSGVVWCRGSERLPADVDSDGGSGCDVAPEHRRCRRTLQHHAGGEDGAEQRQPCCCMMRMRPRRPRWRVAAEFAFQARESFVQSAHMGGAGPLLQTQEDRGAAWSSFVGKLMGLEFVVGYHHFQYFDQPSDPTKLHNTNYGLVSVNDTEYTEMVQAMRTTNLDAGTMHMAGAGGQRCGLDSKLHSSLSADGGAFRGTIRHNLTGHCLTADHSGAVSLTACGTVDNRTEVVWQLWQVLANGVLQQVRSGKCLDIDRSVSQSPKVVLSSNCYRCRCGGARKLRARGGLLCHELLPLAGHAILWLRASLPEFCPRSQRRDGAVCARCAGACVGIC